MTEDSNAAPVPQAPELRAELARWDWMPAAWQALPADSRRQYDDWVLSSGSPRQAQRRAQVVARRTFTGRPWAQRPARIVQAVQDQIFKGPDVPAGPDPMPGA